MNVIRKTYSFSRWIIFSSINLLKRKLLKSLSIHRVHVISDSHGKVFTLEIFNKIKTCIVKGATMSGIKNPKSKTQAGPIIDHYLKKHINKRDDVILEFGEVDCGFALWYKAEKDNINVYDYLDPFIKNYTSLIQKIAFFTGDISKIHVISIIPPTIKDNQDWGNIANLRSKIKTTQFERTKLTIAANRKIKQMCEHLNCTYINLDEVLIDKESMVVDEYYLNENPNDHHLSSSKLGILLKNKLVELNLF